MEKKILTMKIPDLYLVILGLVLAGGTPLILSYVGEFIQLVGDSLFFIGLVHLIISGMKRLVKMKKITTLNAQ